MATPAQEAREYAAQYGFTISKTGDKYEVTGNGLTARLSGYPAVLNAMRRHNERVVVAADTPVTVVSAGIAKDADGSPRADYTVAIKTDAEVLDDLRAGVAWVYQGDASTRPDHLDDRVPITCAYDVSVGVTMRADGSRRLHHTAVVLPAFADFPPEAKERIRNTAAAMFPRAPEHKHWRVSLDSIVKPVRISLSYPFTTRSDALRVVRRMLSDPTSGMRQRRVRIEYVA